MSIKMKRINIPNYFQLDRAHADHDYFTSIAFGNSFPSIPSNSSIHFQHSFQTAQKQLNTSLLLALGVFFQFERN